MWGCTTEIKVTGMRGALVPPACSCLSWRCQHFSSVWTSWLVPSGRKFAPLKCLGKGKAKAKAKGKGKESSWLSSFKLETPHFCRWKSLVKTKAGASCHPCWSQHAQRPRTLSHHKINEAFSLYSQEKTTKPHFPPQQCLDALALLQG